MEWNLTAASTVEGPNHAVAIVPAVGHAHYCVLEGVRMDEGFKVSGDDEWKRIGLPDRLIKIARAAFDTPHEAEPWVVALDRYAANPDAIRAAIAAGIGPAEFVSWRDAGVDSRNVASWSKILSQAGLSPGNVKQWRSAGLNVSCLPLTAPYLSGTVGFDEVLATLHDWGAKPKVGQMARAEELLRVLDTGVGIDELIRLRTHGVETDALLQWCESGVPPQDWKGWIAVDIPAEIAPEFVSRGIDSRVVGQWIDTGLSPAEALELIDRAVPVDTVHEWIAAGVSPTDTAAFLGAGTSVTEARKWIASDVATIDAVKFMRALVSLPTAQEWAEASEFTARDVIDFIEKGVSLEQALDFEARGIDSGQVTRTESGIELDLDPWQVDPADQLPKAIESGHVNITLWTTALGGDPVAHDVHFTWDGYHTAGWYEDISDENAGLSVMSSSPTHGLLAWPDGKDVLLTYNWTDMGLEGHDRLPGVAPTHEGKAFEPAQWLRLADAVIGFVLLDLGSGGREDTVSYLDPEDDCIVNIDEIFRQFLDSDAAVSQHDFGMWLDEATATGRYEIVDGDK